MSIESLDQQTHGLVTKDVKTARSGNSWSWVFIPTARRRRRVKAGDIVVKVAERDIVDGVDSNEPSSDAKPGEPVDFLVKRSDKTENCRLASSHRRPEVVDQHASRFSGQQRRSPKRPVWSSIGVRMVTLPTSQHHVLRAPYARHENSRRPPDSPAAKNGIRIKGTSSSASASGKPSPSRTSPGF